MCPSEEIEEREKAYLIHNLEAVSIEKRQRFRRPDRKKMVKAYYRPAAGKNSNCPRLLRPFATLLQTTNYLVNLCSTSLDLDQYSWSDIYDFVADRLRSVRQDAIIQRIDASDFRILLEKMLPFYLYWGFLRHNYPSRVSFDVELHKIQTKEVFTSLTDNYSILLHRGSISSPMAAFLPEIYIFNVSSPYFPHLFYERFRPYLKNLCFYRNFDLNFYYEFFRSFRRSPLIMKLVLAQLVPQVRFRAFQCISKAYGSKQNIPLEILCHLLDFGDVESLKSCLKELECEMISSDSVKFVQSNIGSMSEVNFNMPYWHCCKCLRNLMFKDLLM
uniref:SAC3/GANP/THP3 conserved domain-containing protein n=1 Tax=Romanomermis culicivorax TaxID=13658 RepID=A0A915HKT0_ROMCU